MLLGFHSNPSRASLLADIHHRKLVELASPDVGALFHDLEATFQPLGLVARTVPRLAYCAAAPGLGLYVKPLTKLVVLRLLKQLAVVRELLTKKKHSKRQKGHKKGTKNRVPRAGVCSHAGGLHRGLAISLLISLSPQTLSLFPRRHLFFFVILDTGLPHCHGGALFGPHR